MSYSLTMFVIDDVNHTVTIGDEQIYYANMTHVSIQYFDHQSHFCFHIKNGTEFQIPVLPTDDAVNFCNEMNTILKSMIQV